eukprot:Hpha_TRINITY_DN13743_c0_g1::TRINITY_DN13743_c0_g1_i3::g.142781::m.142781
MKVQVSKQQVRQVAKRGTSQLHYDERALLEHEALLLMRGTIWEESVARQAWTADMLEAEIELAIFERDRKEAAAEEAAAKKADSREKKKRRRAQLGELQVFAWDGTTVPMKQPPGYEKVPISGTRPPPWQQLAASRREVAASRQYPQGSSSDMLMSGMSGVFSLSPSWRPAPTPSNSNVSPSQRRGQSTRGFGSYKNKPKHQSGRLRATAAESRGGSNQGSPSVPGGKAPVGPGVMTPAGFVAIEGNVEDLQDSELGMTIYPQ